MFDRRFALLLLGAGAVGAYTLVGLLGSAEVEFTRAAPPAPPGVDLRSAVSIAHVVMPLDLGRVALRAEKALAERLAMGIDSADPACTRRPNAAECSGVRLDGGVAMAGGAEASVTNGVVQVKLPLRMDVVQAGERAAAEAPLVYAFKVQRGGGGFEITRVDAGGPANEALKQSRALRAVEAKVRPVVLSIEDELRSALMALPVAAATDQAWQALAKPIELGAGTWLKASPEVAGIGELASIAGMPAFRVPIAARFTIDNRAPEAAPARRQVIQGQINTIGGTTIRVATPIGLEPLQGAIDNAFVKAGTFETRPDRFGPPVKVEVKRTRLYPSARLVAVELDLSASRFEGQVYYGKAHLVGRPTLDVERRVVALADINFPPAPPRDGANAGRAASAPRLASDPFAGRLASVFRIDVAREVDEIVPRTNGLLQRRLDDQLQLSAKFERAVPVSFEVARDGGWLVSDLTGSLVLTFTGGQAVALQAAVPAAKPEAAHAARKLATPELAAAAVVGAATAAATAAVAAAPAARPAGGGLAAAAAAPLAPSAAQTPVTASPAAPLASDAAARSPMAAQRAGLKRVPATKVQVQKKSVSGQVLVGGRRDWVPFATNN